jgi:predicted 3-demethylubiquinone-9 3-methyltransferase (glyoxalase superfamily)
MSEVSNGVLNNGRTHVKPSKIQSGARLPQSYRSKGKAMRDITPCLWFDSNAEEAVNFYLSVFKNSKIKTVTRYGKAGHEIHGKEPGTILTIVFELDGQEFTALNGGPIFKFNEAVSLMVNCEGQKEIDYYWGELSEGSDPAAQQCGWLKDKFGLSWQVVPADMDEMLTKDPAASERVMTALLQMKKLDINALRKAYEG